MSVNNDDLIISKEESKIKKEEGLFGSPDRVIYSKEIRHSSINESCNKTENQKQPKKDD